MTYFVSVIVPCYNKEKTIAITINSLIKQTIFPKIEIVCVDDCSTDKTFKILRNYAKRYKNIKIYQNDKNSSVFVTRKRGIIESHGRYIAWLDPDDWIDSDYLSEMYNNRFIKLDDDVVIEADIIDNYSVYQYKNDNDIKLYSPNIIRRSKAKTFSYKPITRKESIERYFLDSKLFVWNKMFKRKTLSYIKTLPNYYINYSEDYLISIVGGMNADFIKRIKTKSKLYYNLSPNVSHLSKSKDFSMRDESYAKVFHILDSYILEYNKFEYYGYLKRLRYNSIIKLSNHLGDLFDKDKTILEMFLNHDFCLDINQ